MEMSDSRNLFLGYCCWIFMTTIVKGFLFGCSCGDFVPLNPFVFLYENLTLTCILNEEELKKGTTSRDLQISFGDGPVSDIYVFYPDNRTLQYMKNVTSIEESSTYLCSIEGLDLGKGLVGTQYVMIDYKPEAIPDIECVIYNWDEHMNCSWTLQNYKHLQHVDVALIASNDGGRSYHLCPYMAENKTRCYWNRPNDLSALHIPVDVVVWYMYINVTYVPKNVSVVSNIFTITPDLIVKPAPVEGVTATLVQKSCVSFSWQVRMYREQIFRIRYTKSDVQKVIETKINADKATICGLAHSTKYTFGIARKPPVKGYWSDETFLTVNTDQDPEQGHSEMYIIIGGVSGGVILLLILITIVCLKRRHRKENDLDNTGIHCLEDRT